MIKKIELWETSNTVHYECLVHKWVCTKCLGGREYQRQKLNCMVCENTNIKFVEEIKSGWINKKDDKWGCSCVFGSWWKWAGFWRDNYPEAKCRHYRHAFRKWQKIQKLTGTRHTQTITTE